MSYTTHFRGSQLIVELRCRDGMTEAQAKAWIEGKTHCRFDPDAMYKFRYQGDSSTWSGHKTLRVHIMTDAELGALDRESRNYNKKPPWKPGEPFPYDFALGKAPSQPLNPEPQEGKDA